MSKDTANVFVIGDIHLKSNTFPTLVEQAFDLTMDFLEKKAQSGDIFIWLGDILHSWKAVQDPNIIRKLLNTFGNRFRDQIHHVLMGNHDVYPVTRHSALDFLGELNGVNVWNEPFELNRNILLVPHSYSGYTLTKPYDYVFAHLGLYGTKLSEGKDYLADDVLSWTEDSIPNNIVLGHIHRTQNFTRTTYQRQVVIDVVGSLCPVTWSDVTNGGYIDKPIYATIPVFTLDLDEDVFVNRTDYYIKFPFYFNKNEEKRQVLYENGNVLIEESIEEKVELPKYRDKGDTLYQMIDTTCKEYGVDTEEVLGFYKEIGFEVPKEETENGDREN